jgi:hypothetical protein
MESSLIHIRMRILLLLLGSGLFFLGCREDTEKLSYNNDIRPILNKNCLACHGGVRQLGGFSLLFEEEAFGETESGLTAIVRGNHKKSELYKRLIHGDPEKRMPLDADPLSTEEIDLIARWIDEGAEWEKHWSFQPPVFPGIPVKDSVWPKNPIDNFVLDKLAENGLEPNPEAEGYQLIRRIYLDLTGLPPTPEEVKDYISDTSANAYENLVNRLLASPHYGEKWASLWLDLARYANSKGYEKDPHRNIWRYRDWVISAFNQDMPFDQFTVEQLAGDLLESTGRDQFIATGFHRNTMTNTEGGTEDEEFRIAAVIDRLNTTMEVWQGVTISCVQCHDHPYDPIRQEEFYKQLAFFNNTQDADLDSDFPLLELYEEEDIEDIRTVIEELIELKPDISVQHDNAVSEQIRSALFPRLLADFADDYENVIVRYNGPLDNSSTNLNNQKKKSYHFAYSDIPISDLTHLSINYSAEGNDAVIKVYLDSISGPLVCETDLPATGASWDRNNIYKNLTIPVSGNSGRHSLVFDIINSNGRVPEGLARIKEFYLHYNNSELPSGKIRSLEDQLIEYRNHANLNLILKEKNIFPRKTYVFEKGNWLLPSVEVDPDILFCLGEYPDDLPANRLGYAQWLTSEANPLTARVMVNRFWEQLYGKGIVETVEDFGTQGQPPSHPELLDYLSLQFSDTYRWSLKKILKEIVLSATYRQSSRITTDKLEKDPYNTWLSRGPRLRLSAEQVRDQALAVSGLLNTEMGGKSDMPVQPEGTWQVIYSGEKWITTDEDKYRRSVYTYWKRTSPYPSYLTFDAPSREFCVSRRIRTNTPLQALVTLNDPVYTEISMALANRMLSFDQTDVKKTIRYGYELALCRQPDDQTQQLLIDLYHSAKQELNDESYYQMVTTSKSEPGQLTPMTIVANAIINLDEFLTKE